MTIETKADVWLMAILVAIASAPKQILATISVLETHPLALTARYFRWLPRQPG
jgi:hypothetical protein